MVLFEDGSLVALEGTGDLSSKTLHWASGLHKVHRHGSVTSPHQMGGAAIVHPDMREVMPRMPEPLGQHEGTDKHAGERQAATRCMATVRRDHPHRKCMLTDESLRAKAP